MADRAYLERLTKELANDGKLIEAGWVALRILAVPPEAPAVQLQSMRLAYMAGAQHLFSSIMSIMDSDREPTDADLKRMDLINKEIEAFHDELGQWVKKIQGKA